MAAMRRGGVVGLALAALVGLTGTGLAVLRAPPGDPILGATTVGLNPVSMVVDAATGRVFVANAGSNSVSVLDSATGRLLRTVRVGVYPTTMAVDVRTARVFVANAGPDSTTVSVLDAASGRLVRTVGVGAGPSGLAVDSHTGRVFVATLFGQGLDVLEARSGRFLRTIALPDQSVDEIAVSERAGRVFILSTDKVSVLDGASGALIRTVTVGMTPLTVAVDGRTGRALVAGHNTFTNGIVGVLDGASGRLLRTVGVGRDPLHLLVDARSGLAIAANDDDGTVDLFATSAGSRAAAGSTGSAGSAGSIGSAGSVGWTSRSIVVGRSAGALAVDDHTGRLFVANYDRDSVTVLDLRRGHVVRTFTPGPHPQALAVDERTGRLFVATAGGAVASPDPWSRVRRALPRWAPFPAEARPRLVPAGVTVVDEARL